MAQASLRLTVYFGERDRAGDALLADALVDIYERHGLHASAVFRGIEGFGAKHRLHDVGLLTLSEDLPVVSVAVDGVARIEAALGGVRRVCSQGLITLERARMLSGDGEAVRLPEALEGEIKLTVYVGRQERAGGRRAPEAVVDVLHRRGIAGATVLTGIDGTLHAKRERARFLSRNAEVPAIVLSVGEGGRIASALPELAATLARPLMTLERVRVCKRDGRRLAEPEAGPDARHGWVRLTVFSGEAARHDGAPLHGALIRRLRAEGAAGVTSLRGSWGYHGDHAPHGDAFWALRRQVPVVTVIIDRVERARRWFELVDEMTGQTGLVTSEAVPLAELPIAPPG